MKLNKQIPSFTYFFLYYQKEQIQIKSLFWLIKRKFKIHSNLMKICAQLNNSCIVVKTCTRPGITYTTFNFGGLCIFNKPVVQK